MTTVIRIFVALILAVLGAACSSAPLELSVGDCFQDWEGATETETQEVTGVETVSCVDAHDNEVYALLEMTEKTFPGDTEVRDAASQACLGPFEEYVGTPYLDSRLDVGTLFPTESSWAQGDRMIICFLYDVDFVRLTGSMKGSGQ